MQTHNSSGSNSVHGPLVAAHLQLRLRLAEGGARHIAHCVDGGLHIWRHRVRGAAHVRARLVRRLLDRTWQLDAMHARSCVMQ